MSADFYVKENDTAPALTGVLVDADGAAVNIAGATLTLTMVPIDGATPKINGAAVDNDQDGGGAQGAWSYTWQTGDTDTPGYFRAEVEATFGDGSVETYPNDGYVVVRITPELG